MSQSTAVSSHRKPASAWIFCDCRGQGNGKRDTVDCSTKTGMYSVRKEAVILER